MKTKEQILEKIVTQDMVGRDVLSLEYLASYLATIEERLEKVEGNEEPGEKWYCTSGCGCEYGENNTLHEGGCVWVIPEFERQLKDPTPTDKQDCGTLSNSGGITNTPTEVKDWEIRFEEEFGQYRYESVPKDMDVPVEKVKSFIRKLLNK
jgi:hypothetical protein